MAEWIDYDCTWDPYKAIANLAKHGVAFEDAATVFRDPLALTHYDTAHSESEDRWITLGQEANGALLVVIHTFQETHPQRTAIRIVSARRATPRERRAYAELPH